MSEFSRRVTGVAAVGATLAALTGVGLAGEDVRPAYPADAPQATHDCPRLPDGTVLQFKGDLTSAEMTEIEEGRSLDMIAAKIAGVLDSGDVASAKLVLDAGANGDGSDIPAMQRTQQAGEVFTDWMQTQGVDANGPIADSTHPYSSTAHLELMGATCPDEITEPYN